MEPYLGLRRGRWFFFSSAGLWVEAGELMPTGSSGGRGRSVRSWRDLRSSFFFPESVPSFRLRVGRRKQ